METFDFKNNDPLKNFLILFKEAESKQMPDALAMSLATVDSENKPTVRVVLFKGIMDGGFTFFTNYNGKKSQDLDKNKNVGVNFFWSQLDRQVRVEGVVEKLSREQNEAYFKTRPRVSQIGAWASNQSEEISSLDYLQEKFQNLERKFENQEVPCPPNWGGYTIKPTRIEFWFGRVGRMHERYVYTLKGQEWIKSLKSP